MKEVSAQWLTALHDEFRGHSELISNGFKKAGIAAALANQNQSAELSHEDQSKGKHSVPPPPKRKGSQEKKSKVEVLLPMFPSLQWHFPIALQWTGVTTGRRKAWLPQWPVWDGNPVLSTLWKTWEVNCTHFKITSHHIHNAAGETQHDKYRRILSLTRPEHYLPSPETWPLGHSYWFFIASQSQNSTP